MNKLRTMPFIWFASVLLQSCGNDANSDKDLIEEIGQEEIGGPAISDAALEKVVSFIPSPLEISFLIKESGENYNRDFLNPVSNINNYTSNFQKAFNLGVYGTDMGYSIIYNQNQDALFFLDAVRGLAEDLRISQFFDFRTIRKLATDATDLDSLLQTTTTNFEQINSYLRNQNRSNLSLAILIGGWLESLHVTCQAAEDVNNEKLNERIGEQKIVINELVKMSEFYTKDSSMVSLAADLEKLKEAFDVVEITYIEEEPTVMEVDGVIEVVSKTRSIVTVSKSQLDLIADTAQEIRQKYI